MSGHGLQGTWTAKGAESGTVFDEIDLSNESGNEWSDYDEKVCLPLQSSTNLSLRTLTEIFPRVRLELLSRLWSLRPRSLEHRCTVCNL